MAEDYSWIDNPMGEKKKTTKRQAKQKMKLTPDIRRRYRNYANKAAAAGRPVIPIERWATINK